MDLDMVRPSSVPPPCEVREKCTDPAPVSLDSKGGITDGPAACKVFSPGYYTKAPVLAENNYFTPGVYSFELDSTWSIGSALRGGDPAPASDVAEEAPLLSSIPKCLGAPDPVAPYGVVFVFGKLASMTVLNTARMELFSYTATVKETTTHLPNVVSGGQKGVTEWLSSSDIGLEQDLLNVKMGANWGV